MNDFGQANSRKRLQTRPTTNEAHSVSGISTEERVSVTDSKKIESGIECIQMFMVTENRNLRQNNVPYLRLAVKCM